MKEKFKVKFNEEELKISDLEIKLKFLRKLPIEPYDENGVNSDELNVSFDALGNTHIYPNKDMVIKYYGFEELKNVYINAKDGFVEVSDKEDHNERRTNANYCFFSRFKE